MATPSKLSAKRRVFLELAMAKGLGPKVKRKELFEFCRMESIGVPFWLCDDLSCRAEEHGYYNLPFGMLETEEVAVAEKSAPKESTKAVDTAEDKADDTSDDALEAELTDALADVGA